MFELVAGATDYGARQLSTQAFSTGDLIHRLRDVRYTSSPTFTSIQVGAETHIEDLGVITYLNHSCRPNTVVDTERLTVHAARPIAPGDELTYFYPSTEWDLDRPFDCQCGEPGCIGRVVGARHLATDVLNRHRVAPHIQELVRQSGHDAL
jgi:hypothetical protein